MEDEDEGVAELDGFKDFTVSSSWEKLIAAVESVCRDWQSAGRQKLMDGSAERVKGLRNMYCVNAEVSQGYRDYRLELFFAASDNAGFEDWQLGLHQLQVWFGVKDFVVVAPVSLSGVLLDPPEATMLLSTVSIALSNCGGTWPVFVPVHDPTRKAFMGIESLKSGSCKFEADRIGSQVPVKLMHLEGLYDLFTSKLGCPPDEVPRLGVTMKVTYITPFDLFLSPAEEQNENGVSDNTLWDDEFPWAEWNSVKDPVKGFRLLTIWRNRYVSSSIEMAELENASTFDADRWLLKASSSRDENAGATGFSGRLKRLVQAFFLSTEAEFMEDFVTVTKQKIEDLTRSCKVPPPSVLDRVLKDIFHQAPQPSAYDDKSRLVKGAPSDSLFGRFCLHTLWFGDCNIRAIGNLWIEFLREVQWCWEQLEPLPRSSPDDVPDFSTCLCNQKLQLLAKCLKLHISAKKIKEDQKDPSSKKSKAGFEGARKGSAGPLTDLLLYKSNRPLHAPVTQTPPVMTEDMLLEREQALATLENSPSGKAARMRLQTDLLSSDMAAFKAANPDAVLEDFVRWHSPRDWIEDNSKPSHKSGLKGRLSKRMAEPGNTWLQIWEDAEAIPASEQKPIFDFMREGEKVLHYLETLKPFQLLAQVLCTAFVAAADVLWMTPGCKLEPVVSLHDELFSVMAVVLAPLGSLALSEKQSQEQKKAWERDLLQLCSLLEKFERKVAKAASLRQKLPQASEAILSSLLKEQEVDAAANIGSSRERDMISRTLFSEQNVSETWEESLRMGNFLNGHEPLTRKVIFTRYEREAVVYGGSSKLESSSSSSSKDLSVSVSHRMYACGTADDLQIALASTAHD